MWRIGVDTGGTFTDVIAIDDDGRAKIAKVSSTPPNFEDGIMRGITKLGLDPREVAVIHHGTTVTTNAAIMKTGANAALVTTRGFRDVLEMRRGHREDLYDIMWDPPPPLVPRVNRLELDERTNYAGDILKDVEDGEVQRLATMLRKRGVEALAISFLHSYVNPKNELRVQELITHELPDLFVTCSSDILPQPSEFERTSTVVANAYLGPVLIRYLRRLQKGLRDNGYEVDVLLMHSGGGVMTLDSAMTLPVRTAGSGPAAGVMGALAVGKAARRANLISMDMGGTSCDVSVIVEGEPRLTMQHSLEWGLPVRFPSVDFVAIGAGGGSVAWIDAAGYPRSGPESAGASPGPACYGIGGNKPTTTDANLVLKRLNPDTFLGGELSIDPELAAAAITSRFADPLGLELHPAAAGIVRIANSNMASAVRLVTIQKGFDPREFSLVAFGGAGPLHAVEVARELGIPEVLVPPNPGLTSALGLLTVDVVHDASQSFVIGQQDDRYAEAEALLARFEREMVDRLRREGASEDEIRLARLADLRYVGQVHTITVRLPGSTFSEAAFRDAIDAFHAAHEREYRYCKRDWLVQISVLRVEGRALRKPLDLSTYGSSPELAADGRHTRDVYFEDGGWIPTAIVAREGLRQGDRLQGPAIVEEFDSTILLPPDMEATVDDFRNLVISLR